MDRNYIIEVLDRLKGGAKLGDVFRRLWIWKRLGDRYINEELKKSFNESEWRLFTSKFGGKHILEPSWTDGNYPLNYQPQDVNISAKQAWLEKDMPVIPEKNPAIAKPVENETKSETKEKKSKDAPAIDKPSSEGIPLPDLKKDDRLIATKLISTRDRFKHDPRLDRQKDIVENAIKNLYPLSGGRSPGSVL